MTPTARLAVSGQANDYQLVGDLRWCFFAQSGGRSGGERWRNSPARRVRNGGVPRPLLSRAKDATGGKLAQERVQRQHPYRPVLERHVTRIDPVACAQHARRMKIAKRAPRGGLTLRQTALASGCLTAERFDDRVRPERMVG